MNNDGSICTAHAQTFFVKLFLHEFECKELFKLLIFWSVNEIPHISETNFVITNKNSVTRVVRQT